MYDRGLVYSLDKNQEDMPNQDELIVPPTEGLVFVKPGRFSGCAVLLQRFLRVELW